jgi:molecular chaperone HtpG
MATGRINVTADNIFPIIKKFLYSDHEIFLRELVSNAVDATQKLKTLSNLGEAKGELGDLTVHVDVDEKKKTITITDRGIGMTADDVEKYINQVAFSGAEEFLKKYEGKMEGSEIIGHFGLGFYSAFMVASKVEIKTKSFTQGADEKGTHWICEGSPDFEMKEVKKKDRGTEITLHIAEDSTEFLSENKINELLKKYAKFMPVSIQAGEKDESQKVSAEGEEDKYETVKVPNIINNTQPAWIKSPSELSKEDYDKFHEELYGFTMDKPLFNIHLNVDYPFNLTGILYFPKIKPNMEIQKNKIQLYQKQVFITDSVEGIVPDFLTLLQGVIDSPDIPLNVSRSYLQSDGNVKKISNHITKKVADKLNDMFKNDREDFQEKWNDIRVIVEYGMLTEEKFYDKAKKFALYQNEEGSFFTWDEYLEKIKENQIDKDNNTIVLYAAHKEGQHAYIEKAKAKGYDVLILESPLVSHLMQKIEGDNQNVKFARVDSDLIDNLIKKDEDRVSKLTEDDKTKVKESIEANVPKEKFTVRLEDLDSEEPAFTITVPEFMRRMREMQATGGGGMYGMMGDMPEMYDLVVNSNHELTSRILNEDDGDKQKSLITQATDLAKLQQNLLHGEELTNFIKRSYDLIG